MRGLRRIGPEPTKYMGLTRYTVPNSLYPFALVGMVGYMRYKGYKGFETNFGIRNVFLSLS